MQVIVGRIKDNWRLAHLAGTSNLHVLDKFSITLQCERRIVSSADPGNYLLNICEIIF
jgi:vacuolar protein sorting-associated protein 13D